MPRVQVPTEVSGRDPNAVLIEHVPSEMLANGHDADQLVERMGWAPIDAERQLKEFHVHDCGSAATAPARSVRRATARRASNRRATARSRQGDTEASIIDFLAQHPGSTAGDLAKGLNLNTGKVSTSLTELAKTGEIKKAQHGYSAQQAARPRRHQRSLRRSH
jgi:uncharacterized membrane protein